MRLLIVCSAGGHLTQAWALRPFWEQHERIWVTAPTRDARARLAGEHVIESHYPTDRNLPNLARNAVLARRVLRATRPDLILSTGAGVAVPFFALARHFRVPTIHVETVDRFDRLSLTARLLYPFADRFCVQWPELAEVVEGSTCIGVVL